MKVPVADSSGKQYDIDAPDDTTIDKVLEFASKSLGREVRPVDPPSKTAYAVDRFKKGSAGLVGMAGYPVDALAWMMRHEPFNIPVGDDPVGGSKQLTRAWERLTGYRGLPAPSTASEWLVGKPAEFAGAGGPFSAASIARSSRPALASATEALSTYAGGVGAKAGEEFVGRSARAGAEMLGASPETTEKAEQIGHTVGGFGGGLAFGGGTAMAAPRVAATGTEWLRNAVIPKMKDKEEIDRVGKSLFTKHFRESLASDPRYKANVGEALETKKRIPGFEPDLSMAAGTPSVRALQQAAETESPAAAAKGVEARQKAVKALNEYREANFPQGQRSLQELSAGELEALERGVGDLQVRLDADVERLRGKVRSGQFGPDEGAELGALKREQMKAATARTDALYQEVYNLADRYGFQGSLDPLVASIQRYVRDPNRVAQEKPGFLFDIQDAAKAASMQAKAAAMKLAYGEKMPDGIVSFVAKNGGISKIDAGGEFPDVSRTPAWASRGKDYSFYLVHKGPNAKSMDDMREKLVEAGYLPEGASINDMTRLIDDEIRAGEALHFSSRDWDQAAAIQAKKAEQMHLDMGAEGITHDAQARYPASFGGLHSILKRIREEQRYYGGKQTDEARRAMGPLSELEKIVEGQIQRAGPEVGNRLGQADQFFKTTVADPFYRGVAARAFSDRGLIENVGNRLLARGEEGARNFKEVFGDSERAHDLLWNGVLEGLAAKIGEQPVTSTRVRGFYEDHRKFLDQFPTIRSRLMAVDKVTEGLESRAAAIGEQRRAVNRDLVSTLTGRNDPDAYLLGIVSNEQAMRQVAGWAKKNPELGQEIARTYVEGMWSQKDPIGFLRENEKTLKPVFDALGPDHWNKVMTLLTGRSIQKRGAPEPVHKPEVVDDPLRILTGTATSGIFSRIRGAVYKQISPEYVLVDIGGKYFFRMSQEQARDAVNAALYDPKLIDNIMALDHQLSLPKPPWERIRETLGEMKQHYANHAIRVSVVESGEGNEQPAERRSRRSSERVLREGWARGL